MRRRRTETAGSGLQASGFGLRTSGLQASDPSAIRRVALEWAQCPVNHDSRSRIVTQYNSAARARDGITNITLRTAPMSPFDGAIAAARTCYSPRVIGAHEITETAARHDRRAHLRRRSSHRLPARALRVRPREHLAALRLDLPALVPVLQLRAVEPALREAEGAARLRAAARRSRRSDVYEAAIVRAWDRYAELSALLKDDAFAILKELRYVRPTTSPERLKQIEKDAEKRAIETARYVIPIAAFTSMVHTRLGHRAAPPAADGEHRRHTRTRRASSSTRWSGSCSEWDPLFFEKVGLGAIDAATVPETGFPRPRGDGDEYAGEFDRRLNGRWSRLRDASSQPKRWWPSPCVPSSGSPPTRCRMTRRSTG